MRYEKGQLRFWFSGCQPKYQTPNQRVGRNQRWVDLTDGKVERWKKVVLSRKMEGVSGVWEEDTN